jgi:hypothetical protein
MSCQASHEHSDTRSRSGRSRSSPMNAPVSPQSLPLASAPVAPSTAARIFAFASMCVGMFVALLDIQIVSASLRDIGGGLAAGSDETAHTVALKELWLRTYREALTQSFADAYLAILACFVAAALLVPLMRRAVSPVGAPTDVH